MGKESKVKNIKHFYQTRKLLHYFLSGRVAQSVAHLTQEPEVPASMPARLHIFVCRKDWRKYIHEVLVNRIGDLSQKKCG